MLRGFWDVDKDTAHVIFRIVIYKALTFGCRQAAVD